MLYQSTYVSKLGNMDILCDEKAVKGVWFENQKNYGGKYNLRNIETKDNDIMKAVKNWLDLYFAGENPTLETLILAPEVTEYQQKVLNILMSIPYNQTMSYQEIARMMGSEKSSRAVGGAVGRNPILLLIPCHRVIGSNGSLTGYAGGIEKKIDLLKLEQVSQK